jgi:hypothetical protein
MRCELAIDSMARVNSVASQYRICLAESKASCEGKFTVRVRVGFEGLGD